MKTKFIIILIMISISSIGFAQTEFVEAFYMGYDKENQLFSFEDIDGNYLEFNTVSSNMLEKFDLKTPEFIDEAFRITYITKEKNEIGRYGYYKNAIIIHLQLTIIE